MPALWKLTLGMALAIWASASAIARADANNVRPNFVVILADDK